MTPHPPARGAPRRRWAEALLVAALLGGVVATRALDAHAFVTWDEPAWTYRSVHFLLALARGDLRGTALTGHPGVTTTWLGALGLAWNLWVARTLEWAQLSTIGALPSLEVHDAETMRLLAALLPAAKSALPLAHAAIALALYGLLRRLAGWGAAVIVLLVLVLDPYYLALSRVLHIDALTAGLMLVSALAVLLYRGVGQGPEVAPRRRYLLVSGVAAGLAALTKTYGGFVAPFALAVLLGGALMRGNEKGRRSRVSNNALDAPAPSPRAQARGLDSQEQGSAPWHGALRSERGWPDTRSRWWGLARDVVLWAGSAVAAFVVVWPAMWVAPARTLSGVLGLSLEYATAPGDATTSFFRGVLTGDPGAAFYPVAMLYRATPLVMVGVVGVVLHTAVGLALVPRRRKTGEGSRALTWGLLAYAAVHLALITLSAKKFDRYMLPALLALDVVAAIGWLGALGALGDALGPRLFRRIAPGRIVPAMGVAALAVAQAALLLAPLSLSHAIACYNPLVGGLAGAVQTLPVGWGEGVEQAARYLAAQPDAARLRVVTWAVAGVAPLFPGQVNKPTPETLPDVDYVVIYVGDVQSQAPLAAPFFDRQEAEFVAQVAGQPYAWVYRNTFGEALARAIDGAASPGDVIVLNAPSAFERQYRGTLRWAVVEGDEAQVARGLAELARGAGDVFYVAYDGQPSHEHLRRLLARNGLLLDQHPFAYGTLYHYRLVDGVSAPQPVAPMTPGDAAFGGELALEGYGLSADAIEYRQELGLALRWRATVRPGHDYHASVRLVDADGRTWGQHDAPLEDEGGLGTSAWAQGTEHGTYLPLTPEPGTPPGEYRVILGLYRLDDLQRLEVVVAGKAPAQQLDLGPLRVRPATVPPRAEELAIPHPAEVALGDRIQVLGYALSRDAVPSGEEVAATLYWRCLEPLDGDYDLLLRVVADGREVGRTRARPVGDGHPTDRWRAGEMLRYVHAVRIDPDAVGGRYDVMVNLVSRDADVPLAAGDALLTSLTVEHVERLFEPPDIASPQAAWFGDEPIAGIALLGYELAEAEAAPGDTLHLTLYWRATGPIDRSYTAFVHLLDGGGAVRGQRDSVPVSGERPTDGWLEGEVIVDPYAFAVAEDTPSGPHQIEIGLYDPASGERLPVIDAGGHSVPERRLLLDRTVTVRP